MNSDNYTLNEITNFFGLDPNHTFDAINTAFRKKHNEVTLTSTMSQEDKNKMTSFFEELKNKLVLHLSELEVPQNNFIKGVKVLADGTDKGHLDTITNNKMFNSSSYIKPINSGVINPIERHLLINVIHFDTRFKQNYVVESTTETSGKTKYTFNLPTSFKNVISIKLLSFELPETIYNFTKSFSNRTFTVNCTSASVGSTAGVDTEVKIDEGKYTKTTLMAEIQRKLIATVDSDFLVAEDSADTTFIRIRNSSNLKTFTLKFPGIKDKINLGYILGYRSQEFASTNSSSVNTVVASNIPNIDFNNYLYFSFNDYQMSVNQNHYAVINNNFVTKNIFAKLQNKSTESNSDYFIKKSYFGPVTLERVTFELLDRYGKPLDLKGLDYSFSIELEILYKF